MKADEFFARVQAAGGLADAALAERWSLAVLRALTHLLGKADARRHFVTQLPGPLKAALLEEAPHPLAMDREAFLQHVASQLRTHVPEARRAVRAVSGVLKEALSPGQIRDLEAHVGEDIVALLER